MKTTLMTMAAAAILLTAVFFGISWAGERNDKPVKAEKECEITLTGEQKTRLLDARAAYGEKMIKFEADIALSQNREMRIMDDDFLDFDKLRKKTKRGLDHCLDRH